MAKKRITFRIFAPKINIAMEIKQAEFSLSAPMVSMCPKDTKPEYAFIGRSNVGKSSLINMLTNNKKLAKTSSTPGKTLLINHFIINNKVVDEECLTRRGRGLRQLLVVGEHIDEARLAYIRAAYEGILRLSVLGTHGLTW